MVSNKEFCLTGECERILASRGLFSRSTAAGNFAMLRSLAAPHLPDEHSIRVPVRIDPDSLVCLLEHGENMLALGVKNGEASAIFRLAVSRGMNRSSAPVSEAA